MFSVLHSDSRQVISDISRYTERLMAFRSERLNVIINTIKTESSGSCQEARYELQASLDRVFYSCRNILPEYSARLDRYYDHLKSGAMEYLRREEKDLNMYGKLLEYRDPRNLMAQGYALIKKDGILVKSVSDAHAGDQVELTLKDGVLDTTVNKISKS
jgi:exonuclease VII large subunit